MRRVLLAGSVRYMSQDVNECVESSFQVHLLNQHVSFFRNKRPLGPSRRHFNY